MTFNPLPWLAAVVGGTILAAGFFAAKPSFGQTLPQMICAPRAEFHTRLTEQHGEEKRFSLYDPVRKLVIEIWFGDESWTMISVDAKGMACLQSAGEARIEHESKKGIEN